MWEQFLFISCHFKSAEWQIFPDFSHFESKYSSYPTFSKKKKYKYYRKNISQRIICQWTCDTVCYQMWLHCKCKLIFFYWNKEIIDNKNYLKKCYCSFFTCTDYWYIIPWKIFCTDSQNFEKKTPVLCRLTKITQKE